MYWFRVGLWYAQAPGVLAACASMFEHLHRLLDVVGAYRQHRIGIQEPICCSLGCFPKVLCTSVVEVFAVKCLLAPCVSKGVWREKEFLAVLGSTAP